jgi:hypothetical protein
VRLSEKDDPALFAPALEHFGGSVAGAVVDDYDLLLERQRMHPLEHFLDRRELVVGGDDEGDSH